MTSTSRVPVMAVCLLVHTLASLAAFGSARSEEKVGGHEVIVAVPRSAFLERLHISTRPHSKPLQTKQPDANHKRRKESQKDNLITEERNSESSKIHREEDIVQELANLQAILTSQVEKDR